MSCLKFCSHLIAVVVGGGKATVKRGGGGGRSVLQSACHVDTAAPGGATQTIRAHRPRSRETGGHRAGGRRPAPKANIFATSSIDFLIFIRHSFNQSFDFGGDLNRTVKGE